MRNQILILLLLRLRLRRRRRLYYYDYYDYYLRLLVLPTTTTTTAITMHWLLASLLVLPPPTAPLPLVGPKRDARLTELVFQQSLSVCLCMAHPKLYHRCMAFSCRACVVDIASTLMIPNAASSTPARRRAARRSRRARPPF